MVLYIAVKRNYIDEKLFKHFYDGYLALVRQIKALIKSLNPK